LATTEERIRKLVDDNLEIDGRPIGRPLDLNGSLRDSGVSSVDFVAFVKVVGDEFGVNSPRTTAPSSPLWESW